MKTNSSVVILALLFVAIFAGWTGWLFSAKFPPFPLEKPVVHETIVTQEVEVTRIVVATATPQAPFNGSLADVQSLGLIQVYPGQRLNVMVGVESKTDNLYLDFGTPNCGTDFFVGRIGDGSAWLSKNESMNFPFSTGRETPPGTYQCSAPVMLTAPTGDDVVYINFQVDVLEPRPNVLVGCPAYLEVDIPPQAVDYWVQLKDPTGKLWVMAWGVSFDKGGGGLGFSNQLDGMLGDIRPNHPERVVMMNGQYVISLLASHRVGQNTYPTDEDLAKEAVLSQTEFTVDCP